MFLDPDFLKGAKISATCVHLMQIWDYRRYGIISSALVGHTGPSYTARVLKIQNMKCVKVVCRILFIVACCEIAWNSHAGCVTYAVCVCPRHDASTPCRANVFSQYQQSAACVDDKAKQSKQGKVVWPERRTCLYALKLCTRDYVGELTLRANFGFNRYSVGFSPIGEIPPTH